MRIVDENVFEFHADFCKTLSNPTRLKIMAMLGVREMSVGEMADAVGVPIANMSQHLFVLKSRNIVRCRKEGQNVFYSLVDIRMIEACNLIRSVVLDGMKRRGELSEEIDAQHVVVDE